VHAHDGGFGVGGLFVEDVGCAAVGVEGAVEGEVEVGDRAVGGEDFAEVGGEDVFG